MAELHLKVLLIDLDPQANATTGLGLNAKNCTETIYNGLTESSKPMAPLRVHILDDRTIDLYPASQNLVGAEIELTAMPDRAQRLKNFLAPRQKDYDIILIDCPPSLGLLTLNALVASKKVLVPLQCEFFALTGLSHLLQTVHLIQKSLNPELSIEGVLLTMHDRRNRISDVVAQDVRKHFARKVFATTIPRNVKLSEAPSYGKPIIVYEPECPGSLAYRALAREVMKARIGASG